MQGASGCSAFSWCWGACVHYSDHTLCRSVLLVPVYMCGCIHSNAIQCHWQYIIIIACDYFYFTLNSKSHCVPSLFPDVPQPIYIAPVVTDITQSSVVLTWFVPGGVVNSFTVEYCDNATGVCFNSSTSDGRPTVTLGVTLGILMKLTAYYVQVATNNIAFGISQYSPSATFITLGMCMCVHSKSLPYTLCSR